MADFRYRLVNVFAESLFGGNPLCVFEDARGMSDADMRALALQFNLSETTFVLERAAGRAQVRIMTPTHEMPFAGHPSLGTAWVLQQLGVARDGAVTLELAAGAVPVSARGAIWTLAAPGAARLRQRPCARSREQVAASLGLPVEALAGEPMWVDTGVEQCVVPLVSAQAVQQVQPRDIDRWEAARDGRCVLYPVAFTGERRQGREVVSARYFAVKGSGVMEDPGTGSACANLGGWLLGQGRAIAGGVVVEQGDQMGRPCRLYLDLGAGGEIHVGGEVIGLGEGVVHLP
ncbi:PhzF family phenazine biosynthesis protein [Bordetella trematum]|uniref:PhzF family phenazine biosynthesis protein n=1 Tax=Bordetella trematum TaxID=123899 RepID=UPI00398A0BC2